MQQARYASCPDCGVYLTHSMVDGTDVPMSPAMAQEALDLNRVSYTACGSRLWSLTHKGKAMRPRREIVLDALQQMPTIGEKTTQALITRFGEDLLGSMLEDNVPGVHQSDGRERRAGVF